MRSLRNRLIVATLIATLLILLVTASLIYGVIRRALLAEFDETLLAKAQAIASLAEQHGDISGHRNRPDSDIGELILCATAADQPGKGQAHQCPIEFAVFHSYPHRFMPGQYDPESL